MSLLVELVNEQHKNIFPGKGSVDLLIVLRSGVRQSTWYFSDCLAYCTSLG
jgi:hypothetical protein